jgi:hypothetical protein
MTEHHEPVPGVLARYDVPDDAANLAGKARELIATGRTSR